MRSGAELFKDAPMTRIRDFTLGTLAGVALASGAGTQLTASSCRAHPQWGSSVFAWESVPATPTEVGAVRRFFQAPTATLDELEYHVTTLNPGQSPHPPHQHPNEELIIVKEGAVEAYLNGGWTPVSTGSVIFNASNQPHTVRNVGKCPATYFVINWSPPGLLKKPAPGDAELRVKPLDTPAGPNSAQPQLTAAPRRHAQLDRGKGEHIVAQVRRALGRSMVAAARGRSGTDWFVNWADVPSVVRLADRTLAAHWLQKSGSDTYAYDVRLSFSRDDGNTWTPSITPHHDGTKTEHGFASLFPMRRRPRARLARWP